MERRNFLMLASNLALITATGRLAAQTIRHNPFSLGVASGSPSTDGVVLWTRLLAAVGGEPLPPVPIEVRWELARDAQFKEIVQTGTELAHPDFVHSVHLEVQGLPLPVDDSKPPYYWYRFMVGDAVSKVGRTRTLPARDSRQKLTLALASCQNYEHGYFNAYRHMAAEALDCVLFVGDYIYEYGATPNRTRQHNSPTVRTLDEYRARYALYKSDVDLQAAHAAFAWIVTWDDHEVENDYADDRAASGRGADFLLKRAAAYRAYWEHMPLRKAQLPAGPNAQMYRRYAWGQTANLHVLDARQHRDHQVCTPPEQGGSRTVTDSSCPERLSVSSSLLGAAQETWLAHGLQQSTAGFEIVGQQSIMAQMRMPASRSPDPQPAEAFWNDSWDGYPRARARALEVWAQKKNVISLGGDVHATYVNDLVGNFDDPKAKVLATEIVGTSISSPSWPQVATERIMSHNPHIKFGKSDQRGYTVLEVDGPRATAHLRVIDNARLLESTLSTVASFGIEAGKPGAQRN
jgi:alkaline phosphatase D